MGKDEEKRGRVSGKRGGTTIYNERKNSETRTRGRNEREKRQVNWKKTKHGGGRL